MRGTDHETLVANAKTNNTAELKPIFSTKYWKKIIKESCKKITGIYYFVVH